MGLPTRPTPSMALSKHEGQFGPDAGLHNELSLNHAGSGAGSTQERLTKLGVHASPIGRKVGK
jgi:hypothetical protein